MTEILFIAFITAVLFVISLTLCVLLAKSMWEKNEGKEVLGLFITAVVFSFIFILMFSIVITEFHIHP